MLLAAACNGDENATSATAGDSDTSPEPVQECAFGNESGEDDFVEGIFYGCNGNRTAMLEANICKNDICNNPKPIQDFTYLGQGPFITDEDLLYDEEFEAEPFVIPPNTGACCTENALSKSIKQTAEIDCAAHGCLDAHDQFLELYSVDAAILVILAENSGLQFAIDAAHRLQDSAKFYTSVLEESDHFSICTNSLWSQGLYAFPQYPENGLGAIKDVKINDFECDIVDCHPIDDFTGEASVCEENPNWFPGNKGPPVLIGSGAPQTGMVVLSIGQNNQEHPIGPTSDTNLTYQRFLCDELPCLFLLTDLDFRLTDDISFGPLTFHQPEIELLQSAAGMQFEDQILIAEGEIDLQITASISVGKIQLFNGAKLPFFVSNTGSARLTLKESVITLEEARFPLFQGFFGTLQLAPTPCTES